MGIGLLLLLLIVVLVTVRTLRDGIGREGGAAASGVAARVLLGTTSEDGLGRKLETVTRSGVVRR